MKSKNRRSSATRSGCSTAGSVEEESRTVARDCAYASADDRPASTGTGTKRKKNAEVAGSARSAKTAIAIGTNGGEMKVVTGKKKRATNGAGSTSANGKSFSVAGTNHHHHHQSQSNSSASSVVSAPGDPIDPYEFAVKTEDDLTECCGITGTNVPPMKRMKLDRVEDRCLPDSARSSPLPHSTFSQPSPEANSSPLTIHSHNSHNNHHNHTSNHPHHCTGPLSVLTDFNPTINATSSSSSSACSVHRRDNKLDVELSRVASGASQSQHHPTNTEPSSTTPPLRPDAATPSDLSDSQNTGSKYSMHRTETPLTTPAIDMNNGLPRPCRSPVRPEFELIEPHRVSPMTTATSPAGDRHFSVTAAIPPLPVLTPSRKPPEARCVGVNTVLEDLCKGTITEPDLLGPCEPGTTICLNGIVWLETTTGVLVVNVTWRGRTYIGTLLDATQHDFAPPCPRDYVSPFKSSVRSSNRTKRRAGAAGSSFKHNHNGHGNATSVTGSSSSSNCVTTNHHPTSASEVKSTPSQRQRLRGRNTNSPATSTRTASTPEPCPATTCLSMNRPTPTSTPTNNTGTASPGHKPEREESGTGAGPMPLVPSSDEDGSTPNTTSGNTIAIGSAPTPSGQTEIMPHLTEPDRPETTKPHKVPVSSCSSSEYPSENLTETDKSQQNSKMGQCSPPPPRLSGADDDNDDDPVQSITIPNPDPSDGVDGDVDEEEEDEEEVDEDINNSFPITCPLAGCKKRFSHVIALRFHLNHTPHNVPKRGGATEPAGLKTSDRGRSTNTIITTTNTAATTATTSTENSSLSTLTSVPASVPPVPSVTCPPSHSSRPPPVLGASVSIPPPPRAVVPPIPVQHVHQEGDCYNPVETRHLTVVSSRSDPHTHPFVFGCTDTAYRPVIGRPAIGTTGHEPSGPSTRTVTAHTVSIPHGPLVDKVDLTQSTRQVGSGGCSGNAHQQQQQQHNHPQLHNVTTHSKRNNTSNSRNSESTKFPRTSSTGAPCRVPNPSPGLGTNQKSGDLTQQQQQHPSGRHGSKDLVDFAQHVSNPTRTVVSDNGPSTSTQLVPFPTVPTIGCSMSQFANNMALFTSRVDPSVNPLFSLSPDMWSFPNPGALSTEPRAINAFLAETETLQQQQQQQQAARYSSGPGLWMNGAAFPTAPNPISPQNYTPNNHHQHNHHTTNRSSTDAPTTTSVASGVAQTTLAPTIESSASSAYGLPDFLMAAAAMSALGSNPIGNPAVMEMLRSYMMNQSVGMGKSPVPGGTPLGQSTNLPPQAPSAGKPPAGLHHLSLPQPSVCCAPPVPVAQSPSTHPQLPVASLASMMMAAASGSNSSLLPASMMSTFGLSPSQLQSQTQSQQQLQQQQQQSLLSNPSASLDRLDPFKFSAAYLMQQSSTGSQLSSGFPQHSS